MKALGTTSHEAKTTLPNKQDRYFVVQPSQQTPKGIWLGRSDT